MDIFKRIKFIAKKPRLIFITGMGCKESAEVLFSVLRKHYRVKIVGEPKISDILKYNMLIFECFPEEDKFEKWLSISRDPILIATHAGKIQTDKGFFEGDKARAQEIRKLADTLPPLSHLILNYDDESLRNLMPGIKTKFSSFGVASRADFTASDIVASKEKGMAGVNFKINYQGKVVPVWIKTGEKEDVYASLVAAACGAVLGINLVEISNALSETFLES